MQLCKYCDQYFQGQEVVAENALSVASKEGHWVILQVNLLATFIIIVIGCHNATYHFAQNIHLVAKWLSKLEKTLEQYSEGSHESYRVYMSAEPAPIPESHIIPQVSLCEPRWHCVMQDCNSHVVYRNGIGYIGVIYQNH